MRHADIWRIDQAESISPAPAAGPVKKKVLERKQFSTAIVFLLLFRFVVVLLVLARELGFSCYAFSVSLSRLCFRFANAATAAAAAVVDDGTVQLIVVVVVVVLIVVIRIVVAGLGLPLSADPLRGRRAKNFYFWLAANFLALSAIYQKFLPLLLLLIDVVVVLVVLAVFFGGTWRELAGNRESFRWCAQGQGGEAV